jgi:hypothetical protein
MMMYVPMIPHVVIPYSGYATVPRTNASIAISRQKAIA